MHSEVCSLIDNNGEISVPDPPPLTCPPCGRYIVGISFDTVHDFEGTHEEQHCHGDSSTVTMNHVLHQNSPISL